MVLNYVRDTLGIKSSIQQEENSFHQQVGLKSKEETSKVLYSEHTKCGTGEVRRRSVGPMVRVKEDGKVLHVIKSEKANWIGHVLRRNCPIQHVIEGKIEGGIGGKRRKKT